jgi:hypothetical protein
MDLVHHGRVSASISVLFSVPFIEGILSGFETEFSAGFGAPTEAQLFFQTAQWVIMSGPGADSASDIGRAVFAHMPAVKTFEADRCAIPHCHKRLAGLALPVKAANVCLQLLLYLKLFRCF